MADELVPGLVTDALGEVAGATGADADAFELLSWLFELLLLLLLLFEEPLPFEGAFGAGAGLVEAAVVDRVVGGRVASLRACVLSGFAVPETPLPNAPPAPMPPPAAKPPPEEPPVRRDKVRPSAFRAGERYEADGAEPPKPVRLRFASGWPVVTSAAATSTAGVAGADPVSATTPWASDAGRAAATGRLERGVYNWTSDSRDSFDSDGGV